MEIDEIIDDAVVNTKLQITENLILHTTLNDMVISFLVNGDDMWADLIKFMRFNMSVNQCSMVANLFEFNG